MRYWFIVCLTLLQALMSIGGANAHELGWAHVRGGASLADHCGDIRHGDETPAKEGRPGHCCIFCVAGGCGGLDLATTHAPTTLAHFFFSIASARRIAPPAPPAEAARMGLLLVVARAADALLTQ